MITKLPYNYVALPPMTYVALQLMTNPPKMGNDSPVIAHMVEALTSANAQLIS